ncbi:unnamed protein product [Hymenolepis diminuta]|uniref:SAM domain-containing protein n=1 Tax=Hymenolepis diminuta TaxID=6216 RepID=A0A0R3SW04_HYMDI|nr:unnamed protein product [Hymenolepis diminuta]
MLVFSRKKSKPSKKAELKLHIAQESREPVYDLSEYNQIHSLPTKFGDLRSLEDLDLDGNPLSCLPVEMGRLINLKQLSLPSTSLTFPPQDICKAGVLAIILYLRKAGKILDDELELAETKISTGQDYDTSSSAIENQGFCDFGLNRRSDLHRKVEEELNAHAELAKRVAKTRVSSVKKLAQEEHVMQNELLFLQKKRDEKRKELVNSLRGTLDHADNLIKLLQKRQQITVEDIDLPSLDSLPYFTLSDENRQKILESMNDILVASETAMMRHRDIKKNIAMTNSNPDDVNPAIQSVLNSRQANQAKLAAQFAIEEREQMKAFECLQQEHDLRRRQIIGDIRLIEAELCRLTQAEQERKATQAAASTTDFSERRKDLVRLLAELRKQKKLRESELHKRLVEMEEQKARDQSDYWLVQYQRLIDRKPAVLNEESFLSDEIREVLVTAGAENYLPNFEYHRITPDQFSALTDEDLIRIGVSAVGVRKSILEAIVAHGKIQKDWMVEPSAPSKSSVIVEKESDEIKGEIINESSSPEAGTKPSAPPADIVAHFEAECCICQNAQCSIIFLPCGHVCCCVTCSAKVSQCPLCRVIVQQRVQLS